MPSEETLILIVAAAPVLLLAAVLVGGALFLVRVFISWLNEPRRPHAG